MRNSTFLRSFLWVIGISLVLTSCQIEALNEITPELNAVKVTSSMQECNAIIDFQPLAAGTIVSSLSSGNGVSGIVVPGVIQVYGKNLDPARPDENHAMIFDTDNPTGLDFDLVVPGADYQKVMIISEDLDSFDPDDDNIPGGIFTFDFSGFATGVVNIQGFIAIDTEEGGSWIALNSAGVSIANGIIAKIANGTDQMVTVGVSGVTQFLVTLNGSGAVDNFCMKIEKVEEGCTLTQGFWKNTKKGPWPAPYNRANTFFLSGQTWQEVLTTSPANNAYYQAAHQFIAASLNMANGASSPDEVDDAMALGLSLFSTYTPADIAGLSGSNSLRAQFISINNTLDSYNRGEIGPGHCDD